MTDQDILDFLMEEGDFIGEWIPKTLILREFSHLIDECNWSLNRLTHQRLVSRRELPSGEVQYSLISEDEWAGLVDQIDDWTDMGIERRKEANIRKFRKRYLRKV